MWLIINFRICVLSFPEKYLFRPFYFKIYKNHNSQGNSNVDYGIDNQAILAFRVSKEALWKSVHFSFLLYFGFIILTLSVYIFFAGNEINRLSFFEQNCIKILMAKNLLILSCILGVDLFRNYANYHDILMIYAATLLFVSLLHNSFVAVVVKATFLTFFF